MAVRTVDRTQTQEEAPQGESLPDTGHRYAAKPDTLAQDTRQPGAMRKGAMHNDAPQNDTMQNVAPQQRAVQGGSVETDEASEGAMRADETPKNATQKGAVKRQGRQERPRTETLEVAGESFRLPRCDIGKRYVKVIRRRASGFVEFEFSVAWRALCVELVLHEKDFEVFCRRNHVVQLPSDPAVDSEGESETQAKT